MCAICNFKMDFGVSHPSAFRVAVAARTAIEAGLIEPIDETEGALAAARAKMSAVDAMNLLQARIEGSHSEDALLGLPDFYVLLIENDTWAFFHATTSGFDPDIAPEMPDVTATDDTKRSNLIVSSEAALRGWLEGRIDMEHAIRESLFVVDAPSTNIATLEQMLADAELHVPLA